MARESRHVPKTSPPKAVLGPLPGRANVEAGVAEGWITAGTEVGLAPVRRVRSKGRLLDALRQDRGE
jgi:hypothetical protein